MPVHAPDIPDDAASQVQRTIRELLATPGFVADVIRRPVSGVPRLSAPHTIFNLDVGAVAEGQGLEAATQTGVRFLVMEGSEPFAAVELEADERGRILGVSNFVKGNSVSGLVETLASLERRPEVERGSFELRVLRIPPLYVLALWLKNDRGDDDLLTAISPERGVRPEPQPASVFLEALRERAAEIAALTERTIL